jgi:hypothetical protein
MIFIDDIDSDELSLKACVYADDAGWKRYGNEAPYEVSSAFCSGYMDGYRAAIADEKAKYAEAKKLIEEAHQKERALYLATINKLSKKEIIEHWENKLSEQSKRLLDRMRSERFEDK